MVGQTYHAMSVIPLTIFFSLLLAGIFVVLFARQQRRGHLSNPERDSLLPLADEMSRAEPDAPALAEPHHAHTDDECAAGRPDHPPCARCRKRAARAAAANT